MPLGQRVCQFQCRPLAIELPEQPGANVRFSTRVAYCWLRARAGGVRVANAGDRNRRGGVAKIAEAAVGDALVRWPGGEGVCPKLVERQQHVAKARPSRQIQARQGVSEGAQRRVQLQAARLLTGEGASQRAQLLFV